MALFVWRIYSIKGILAALRAGISAEIRIVTRLTTAAMTSAGMDSVRVNGEGALMLEKLWVTTQTHKHSAAYSDAYSNRNADRIDTIHLKQYRMAQSLWISSHRRENPEMMCSLIQGNVEEIVKKNTMAPTEYRSVL